MLFEPYVPKCHFKFFPPLGLWSGIIFLIAQFPDHCLIVPFCEPQQMLRVGLGSCKTRL